MLVRIYFLPRSAEERYGSVMREFFIPSKWGTGQVGANLVTVMLIQVDTIDTRSSKA